MWYRWLALLLALAVGVGAQTAPRIVAHPNQTFTVTFDKGAVWACTVFRMQKATETPSETFPDGHYTPRHCWSLDETFTSYQDDWAYILPYDSYWRVWAEIGYRRNSEIVYVHTNTLEAYR
jgi:hypothetical protein